MTVSRLLAIALLPTLVFPPQFALAQMKGDGAKSSAASVQLDGYSKTASDTEKQWESKFRALPSTDNLRENMRRLSARPHHVGSPYDQDNAEWILAQLKSYGLDAQIETFDALFPT